MKQKKRLERNALKLTVVTSVGCVIMKICFFPSFNVSVLYNEHALIL